MSGFKRNSNALEFAALLTEELVLSLSSYTNLNQTRHGVDDHMNTKLILAALMMSLSLAACGQRETPAEATTEPAPPADTAPAEATPPAEGTDLDATSEGATEETAPAEGDAAEPAPAQ